MRSGPAAPARSTRRAPWRDGAYLALDFETTGLDMREDRIVSFGAVHIADGAIGLRDATHRLVSPGERVPSRTSVTIHRLRPVDLARAMPLEQARAELTSLLERRYLVAWYARVEVGFLSSIFAMPGRRWAGRTIDVRDLLVAAEGASTARMPLSEAAALCGVPVADPHHALDDALVTAQLFLVLASRLEVGGLVRTVGDLVRLPPAT